jgi:mannan endo-1,4-beta-mannosidase
VTVPALAFCCLYASGVLGTVAPKSWHPPEVSQAQLASHAKQAARAARAEAKATAHAEYLAKLRKLGRAPGSRNFGVAISGNALQAWHEGTQVSPQLLMTFQSWHGRPMPTKYLKEASRVGIRAEMFTWEPWRPPGRGSSVTDQESAQPKYSNQAIADGKWDPYIKRWADTVGKFPNIRVYIRFGHEMNGNWYPWSMDPPEYVLAWRHIWTIFHQQEVTNAKFVWSADFGEGPPNEAWQQNLMAYWPGAKYVNEIGTTMINFGGSDSHSVDQFTQRIDLVHQLLMMPLMLTEVDTDKQGRSQWMLDLARYVGHTSWIKSVVWSQQPSYGKADMPTVGNMSWQVSTDKNARAQRAFDKLVEAATKKFSPDGNSLATDSGA